MRPRFNGCTIKDTGTECPLCTHRTTLGGNPILLKEVIELPNPDEWSDAVEKIKDVNVVIGDIICISCGDDHNGAFHNAHDCVDHAVHHYGDGVLGDYYECGKCGSFVQAG
jgi:DNA-directed RNA polymerase subunit RPC12/RpoP